DRLPAEVGEVDSRELLGRSFRPRSGAGRFTEREKEQASHNKGDALPGHRLSSALESVCNSSISGARIGPRGAARGGVRPQSRAARSVLGEPLEGDAKRTKRTGNGGAHQPFILAVGREVQHPAIHEDANRLLSRVRGGKADDFQMVRRRDVAVRYRVSNWC